MVEQRLRRAIIVGAGVIGLSCAISLRRAGWDITVIDRLTPGEGCSFGNSGAMPRDHAFPLATPGILRKVPGYLTDAMGSLRIRPSYLPRVAPWLLRFIRASQPSEYRRITGHLLDLMRRSYAAWTELIELTGLAPIIRDGTALTLYRTTSELDAGWPNWQLMLDLGAPIRRLNYDELCQIEPDLPLPYRCAVMEPNYRYVLDPYEVPLRFARHLVQIGGRILRESVNGFTFGREGVSALRTNRNCHAGDMFIIAAGAWSGEMASEFGHRVPLESARGYHVTLPASGVTPKNVLLLSDKRASLTPMSVGLRIGGNIEFSGLRSAPDFRRTERQLQILRELYPAADTESYTTWAGDRPMLPDSLPVIDRCLRYPNVIFAFGHGQYGLALAAITGALVGELAHGRKSTLDLSPFRIGRF